MNIEERIAKLTELGDEYIEAKRHFTNGIIKIDQDVVVYHSDADFEKKLKNIKK